MCTNYVALVRVNVVLQHPVVIVIIYLPSGFLEYIHNVYSDLNYYIRSLNSLETTNTESRILHHLLFTIANNATSTESPDKLTAPNTKTISTLLKKKEEQLKKLRDFTRRIKERIESECIEAVQVSL